MLSEEEFPDKELCLPSELMLFVDNDLIEILWVKNNEKAFKKVVYTLDKYRDVPVISADDDCIYKINYAEMLYLKWLSHKKCVISFNGRDIDETIHTGGCYTLFPPYCFGRYGIDMLDKKIVDMTEDDKYYSALKCILKIDTKLLGIATRNVLDFYCEEKPLHDIYRGRDMDSVYNAMKRIIKKKMSVK